MAMEETKHVRRQLEAETEARLRVESELHTPARYLCGSPRQQRAWQRARLRDGHQSWQQTWPDSRSLRVEEQVDIRKALQTSQQAPSAQLLFLNYPNMHFSSSFRVCTLVEYPLCGFRSG